MARRRASIIISEEAAAAAAAADASFKAAQVAEQQKLLHKAAEPRRNSSSNGSMSLSLPLPMLRKRSSSTTDNIERSASSSEQTASDSMAGLVVVGSEAGSMVMQPLPAAPVSPAAAEGWSDNLLAGGGEQSGAPPAAWDNISLDQPSPSGMPAQSAPLPHFGMPLDLSSMGMPTSTPPGSAMPPGGSGSSTPNKRGAPSRRNTGSMPGTPGKAANGSSGGAGEEGWELVSQRGLPAAAAATALPSDTLTRVQSIMDSLVAEAVSGGGAGAALHVPGL
jgi:hypothetical protein